MVPEPCSSKVEVFQLLRILAAEADLVWVVGCPESLCQLLEGSTRMGKRLAYAQQYLSEIGLEPERLGMSRFSAGDRQALEALVAELRSRARTLPLNPGRLTTTPGKEPR